MLFDNSKAKALFRECNIIPEAGTKNNDIIYDLAIIGGGINGSGIARDAAGRGLSVYLAEMGDLGGATSSNSTKLIHGGLRYLETYQFRLVREALTERDVLMRAAPFMITPLRFVLPHLPSMRPKWMLRLGLWLYDFLSRSKVLSGTETINLAQHEAGTPLDQKIKHAFEYSDCWVDDARLVILNALDARDKGAVICPRTKIIAAERYDDYWQISTQKMLPLTSEDLSDLRSETVTKNDGQRKPIKARVLVNAAGPWVNEVFEQVLPHERTNNAMNSNGNHPQSKTLSPHKIRHVRGSHIVVPKFYDHQNAYIFQNPDQRIVFAIPFQQEFLLIGTTEEDHHSALSDPEISETEITYLVESVNAYFDHQIEPEDICWTYAGIRPLVDEMVDEMVDDISKPSEGDEKSIVKKPKKAARSVTRDYQLVLDAPQRGGDGTNQRSETGAPILHIYGGKITTYRALAEKVMDRLEPFFPGLGQPWTGKVKEGPSGAKQATHPLPGGDMAMGDNGSLLQFLKNDFPFLDQDFAVRLFEAYGLRAWDMLGTAERLEDLGEHFGYHFYESEIRFLIKDEWAQSLDDILWRRTKMGLHLDDHQIARLKVWWDRYLEKDPSEREALSEQNEAH